MGNRMVAMLAAFLITGLILGQPVMADEGASPAAKPATQAKEAKGDQLPETTLDRVVVSATRTEQTAFEAPASVIGIGKEAIERTQARTVKDILEDVPNVEFSDPTNPFIQKPSLRGLNTNQTTFKIDGARQNYSSQSGIGHSPLVADPEMLKEVEVLRGPSSALHGSGGIGGVISLRTKDAADFLEPDETFGARLKTGYQSGTSQTLSSAALYGRQGIFDILGQGAYRDFGDTHTTNPSPTKDTSYRTGYSKSGMLKLSACPTEDQALSLSYNYYDGFFGSTRAVSTFTEEQHRLVGNYEYAPSDNRWMDLKLTAQGEWRENEYLNDVPRQLKDTFDSLGGSVQNTSRFAFGPVAENALTYGVDFYRDHQEGTDMGEPDPSRPDASAEDLGLFIQDEITILDRVKLIPALRFTSYSRTSDSDTATDQDDSKVTPKFTAQVEVCPWLSVFGTYAQSYRPPSLDEIYFAIDHDMPWGKIRVLPNPNLKPETAETWEMGFNVGLDRLFTDNDPFRLKATYFREDVDDLIEAQQTKGFATPPAGEIHYQSINVGSVHRFGYELEGEYIIDNLSLSASYGKTLGWDEETGNRTGGSPEKLSLRAGYAFPSRNLTVYWKSRFVGAYRTFNMFDDATVTYNPYTVHGIGLTWTPSFRNFDGFRLDLGVDNLFDTRYQTSNGGYDIGQNIKMSVSYEF
ncbi:hemoglobin/transferrin/lactoferrin receptor protein [Desulfobaculum xiamenense]|uniref:Hemoglobin/transferrin/lactoferrin receptor protein n=1 Tax=Desulfobaculum xiamenense TaxID=995050 RepID=A0A846QTD1_9BACT|nr:TonB-dependent hemoglobin/transferrin/lactoferrin family receptor [Desulfobaculum xiamenense]NJB67899.1 hemoglobin/transferrin/lactoferrin receptor protein [Desulfobaculum xiamenense]